MTLPARLVLAFGVAVVTLTPTARAQGRGELALAEAPAARFVPDQLLVQFAPGASPARRAAARARVSAVLEEVVVAEARRPDAQGELELVRLPPGVAIAAAIRGLEADPTVQFAEPNWIYVHHATSDDPNFTNGSLWGMYGDASSPANRFGSQAAEAWAVGHTGSSAVYVGVIDEGIMFQHPDLSGNVWTNPFDPPNGVDDDGNGFVDDVHGWDFASNDASIFDGPQDDHGTHVAGTIGARRNATGVVGASWDVTLVAAKFLGRNGGTTANAIKAVDYVTSLKVRHGLRVVATNNSWGGGGFSQALLDAIQRGGDAGILFIAAAGNGGRDAIGDDNDRTPSYPASYVCRSAHGECVLAVAAISSTGARASFSNYGAISVDLGAPGVGIWSTLPAKNGSGTYGSYSGTSMATPHVTGAAALYAASHPDATLEEIRSAILNTAAPTPSLAGRTATGGRLDASGF